MWFCVIRGWWWWMLLSIPTIYTLEMHEGCVVLKHTIPVRFRVANIYDGNVKRARRRTTSRRETRARTEEKSKVKVIPSFAFGWMKTALYALSFSSCYIENWNIALLATETRPTIVGDNQWRRKLNKENWLRCIFRYFAKIVFVNITYTLLLLAWVI